jgi:site-specific recombinase XerD
MRHAGITLLCNLAATEGHSLKDVQEAADHASLQTTMIYWDRSHSKQGKMSSLLEKSLAM